MSNWSLRKQTEQTLGFFQLTKEQIDKVMFQWAENTYEDTQYGHDEAQAELIRLCRWESMRPEQREREKKRLAKDN